MYTVHSLRGNLLELSHYFLMNFSPVRLQIDAHFFIMYVDRERWPSRAGSVHLWAVPDVFRLHTVLLEVVMKAEFPAVVAGCLRETGVSCALLTFIIQHASRV